MISGVKSKLFTTLVTIALLLGGLAILNFYSMSMQPTSEHFDYNTTCKIACFGQAIGNLGAAPTNPESLVLVLSFAGLVAGFAVGTTNTGVFNKAFRYSLGPPLYKRFESYRD
ncbi:hypothetical protein HYX70_00645 [Candidatus Saccharibacteria bacterium]|nr:hypothetical protein [Candidatus Saccharibacteria bacterium]